MNESDDERRRMTAAKARRALRRSRPAESENGQGTQSLA